MKKTIIKNDLSKLISNVSKFEQVFNNLNGQTINARTVNTFVSGPALHQKTATQTEKESAVFEQNHPELFIYFCKHFR